MFSTYEEFKDTLFEFHPEKIGFTYNEFQMGWIDDPDSPIKLLIESDNSWSLYLIDREDPNSKTVIRKISANKPLEVRSLLHRIGIIELEDFRDELVKDSDVDYPDNQ